MGLSSMVFSPRRRKKLLLLAVLTFLLASYLYLVRRQRTDIASVDVRQSPQAFDLLGSIWGQSKLSTLYSSHSGLNALSAKSNDASTVNSLASSTTLSMGKGNQGTSIIKNTSTSGNTNHSKKQSNSSSSNTNLNNLECLQWVNLAPKPPYFLTAVLLVRIYEKDKAKLTTAEMKMWLQYLRYAGVEHVYIYDAFVYKNESQLPHLKEFLKDGYVTYVDWHTHNPYTISGTQVTAYQNCVNVYKDECRWQAAIDIDEYPFSPRDQSTGFLFRYMKEFERAHPDVSELSMQNFLFLGKPRNKELMIERVMRRTPKRSNVLVKPIYKPRSIRSVSIHHNSLRSGYNMNAPVEQLRMNHYWGARLQNWGNDTEETLKMTIPDNSMEPIIEAFKRCESFVRRYLR